MINHVPFAESSLSVPLECVIQLHQEKYDVLSNNNRTLVSTGMGPVTLQKLVRMSTLPGILDRGDYQEPTTELIENLNYDFRLCPTLLHAVAMLHTGCLIMHKDLIFVVTVEVYGQAKSIDIHAETSLKSFPSVSGSPYDALSVGIHEEADGAGMKRKLKIASKTMTVLITLSASLSPQPTVNIGPERASTIEMINPSSARICYFEEEIDKFLTAMKQGTTYTAPKSVSSFRQLVSGSDDPSTYLSTRATLPHFDSDILQPATVFTLRDLPHNQGYGSSSRASLKIAS